MNKIDNIASKSVTLSAFVSPTFAELHVKVNALEKSKGFHTQGQAAIRPELETLFSSAIQLKGMPDFNTEGRLVIANLARLYAMTFYASPDFAVSRMLTLFSLNSLLSQIALESAVQVAPEMYSSLNAWKDACLAADLQKHATTIEDHFIHLNREVLLSITHDNLELQWMLASNLRWLGHSCQNSVGYEPCEKSDKVFDQVYGTCGDLLKAILKASINNSRSETEFEELKYNTVLFLHMRKHPGDIDGAYVQFKEQVLSNNPSAMLHARFCNLFAVQYEGKGQVEKAFTMNSETIEIYQTKPQNISPFHFANAHCNNARLRTLLIEKNPLKYNDEFKSKIQEYYKVTERFISDERVKGEEHPYFMIWELNIAKMYEAKGEIEKAKFLTKNAITVLTTKHAGWSESSSLLLKTRALLQKLESL